MGHKLRDSGTANGPARLTIVLPSTTVTLSGHARVDGRATEARGIEQHSAGCELFVREHDSGTSRPHEAAARDRRRRDRFRVDLTKGSEDPLPALEAVRCKRRFWISAYDFN